MNYFLKSQLKTAILDLNALQMPANHIGHMVDRGPIKQCEQGAVQGAGNTG